MNGSSTSRAFSQSAADRPKAAKHSPPYSIRFTDEERAQLNRDAGTLSLATYIRLNLFCDGDPSASPRKLIRKRQQPSAELAVLGHMLGGLGRSRLASNLNQLAKAANVGALPVTSDLEQELHEACEAIGQMRAELIEALGIKAQ